MDQPRCLVAHTSAHGNTREIAERIAAVLREAGLEATVADLARERPDPTGYALVVAGGSVHAGRLRRDLLEWLGDHRGALHERPCALFTVSLAATGTDDEHVAEVRGYADEMRGHVAPGTPVASFAGALQYRAYRWPTRWLMRRIARKQGLPTDASRDHVFTDWDGVERFAADAVARARRTVDVDGVASAP